MIRQMEYKIICARGHYEAYDSQGKFVCSGDTLAEVEKELDDIKE